MLASSWRAVRHSLGRYSVSGAFYSSTRGSELPDYGKTSVNVHEHKLKRPDKPPPPSINRRWKGLKGLKERTKGSLVEETLQQMESDDDFKLTAAALKKLGQKQMTIAEWKIRQKALDKMEVRSFMQYTRKQRDVHGVESGDKILRKKEIGIMQVNIGLYCNQACNHCHVESSPKRQEMMSRDVVDKCLDILVKSPTIHTVDITGGAPELCTEFRYMVEGVRRAGRKVIDRCNLTSLLEPGQEDTADFLAKHKVHVIASLPCYTAKNVNLQRGKGVFDKSIQGLLLLNSLGYGKEGTGLKLDLMYNPLGGFLPPPQTELMVKYQEELWDVFGIRFNDLFTATNMPIKRFFDFLHRRNELEDYIQLLVRNFNVETVDKLMCVDYLSVSWDGVMYDCDFNQQLDMPVLHSRPMQAAKGQSTDSVRRKKGMTVWDIQSAQDLQGSRIVVDNHCFGCTAGMGSS